MTSTTTPGVSTDPGTGTQLKDVRGFWRILLAVIAPLPLLAEAVYYFAMPSRSGENFADTVAGVTGHESTVMALQWVGAIFTAGMIPATFAVIWVSRRGAPRLTTAAAVLTLVGFLFGFTRMPNDDMFAAITVQEGLDATTVGRLDEAFWAHPMVGAVSLLWIIGLAIGQLLLGIALWRSKAAPAWAGIALAIGGFTHPFMPTNIAQGLGLIVGAAGFAGASYALLRMRNDDFDLPALTKRTP
jgi:hypothetical protein